MIRLTDSLAAVSLRTFTMDDAAAMTALADNPRIAVNLRDGFPNPYTLQDAERFLKMATTMDPQSFFAIEYQDVYVGNISLMPGTDVYRKSAEIGYFIGEPYWGKGIATAAVKLIIDYGFKQLGLARIHTGVYEYNPASCHVLEKCGFQKEGVFRKSVYKQGQLWDEIRYALLR
jgi:RimJ/RimL family protein N-acetyltransferase